MITFSEAIKLFLKHLDEVDRSTKTIKLYGGYLTRFDDSMTERLNRPAYLDEVSSDDLERYLYEPPNDANLSQSTRQVVVTAFKSFYTFCHMKGYCDINIGRKVTWIKVKPKERAYITETELLHMAEYIHDITDRTMMLFMFYTGMRVGEAIALTFEDFHLEEGYIHIRKQKSKFDRDIPISIKLRIILENYMEYRSDVYENSDKVFPYRQYDTLIMEHFNRVLKRAAKLSEIKADITSHILRHSFASNLIEKGVDIVKIKKLLGHENLQTTQIYLHTNLQLLRSEIDKL